MPFRRDEAGEVQFDPHEEEDQDSGDTALLPEVRWGSADAPLPNWREDSVESNDDDALLDETPPDVVSVLGFDPLIFEGLGDGEDYESEEEEGETRTDSAAWNEADHPRDPEGKFTSGGGGGPSQKFSPPAAPQFLGKYGQAVTNVVKQGFTKGSSPEAIAHNVKLIVGNYKHSSIAKYGNTLIGLLEKENGLKAGSLGKAVAKGKGPAPEPPAPAPKSTLAPPPKAAEPPPEPSAPGVVPKPHPESKYQQAVYDIAQNSTMSLDEKATAIAQEVAKTPTGGFTYKYAEQVKAALGISEPKPPEPAPTPAPTPPPAPKPKPPANVWQMKNKAKLENAKTLLASAAKVANAAEPEARRICPSLARPWWKKVDAAAREACQSYKGGSGSINSALRDPKTVAYSQLQTTIDHIDELFEHPEAKLKQDVILRRGESVPKEMIAEWKDALAAGKIVRPQRTGFTSTSMASAAAFSGHSVQYEIVAKAGTPALGIWAASSSFQSENEVLLRHGIAFDIFEIEEKGSQHIVRCRTI